MGSGTPTDRDELPPAAYARRAENEDRHRAIARALHEPPPPVRPQITEKLEGLRAQIEQFRARAIDLHVKLVDLESKDKGDSDVRALRAAMMASVVRIEGVVRALIDTPDPTAAVAPAPPTRFPDGTRIKPES
jgi:hypothetical protein